MSPLGRLQRIGIREWLKPVTVLVLVTITLMVTVDAGSLSVKERHPGTGIAESRTFGRIRRLQAMIVPVMFFLGVMKTLLAFLVAVSLKTLFVGISILMINVGLALAKVIAFFKSKHSYDQHGGGWSGDKNIHVHIHNDGHQHGGIPVEFDHAPPASLLHNSAPNVFPSYGPPTLGAYNQRIGYRSRIDDTVEPIYVSSSFGHQERQPKEVVTDRDRLNQIYAQWRQLQKNGR